jgi:hypothetical protein
MASFARFSAGFETKPVQFGADQVCMTKHTSRLLPVAIVVTGFIASLGGFFSGH